MQMDCGTRRVISLSPCQPHLGALLGSPPQATRNPDWACQDLPYRYEVLCLYRWCGHLFAWSWWLLENPKDHQKLWKGQQHKSNPKKCRLGGFRGGLELYSRVPSIWVIIWLGRRHQIRWWLHKRGLLSRSNQEASFHQARTGGFTAQHRPKGSSNECVQYRESNLQSFSPIVRLAM